MADTHVKFEHDKYYHIYNRGNNRENLFKNENNYYYFLKKWKIHIAPYVNTFSYCLMPNHFHFLVKVKNGKEIPGIIKSEAKQSTKPSRISRSQKASDINKLLEDKFRNLFSAYTLALNNQQNRTGSLFQKRFKRVEITNDACLTTIIHYIHHNPIRHEFVNDYSQWKFSSYNAILSNGKTSLSRDLVIDWFGGIGAFKKFHEESRDFNRIKSFLLEDKSTNPERLSRY